MRERGLKLIVYCSITLFQPVAPHAGAWIETDDVSKVETGLYVAPHAGAWIETY